MDAGSLAKEFAERERSYLWQSIDPDTLAAWVLGQPAGWAELDEMAGAREALPTAEETFAEVTDHRVGDRAHALALVGGFARMAVPVPIETAGPGWLIAAQGRHLVRLTVGLPEVAYATWNEDDDSLDLTLRIAASPIDDALAAGELDEDELTSQGIERSTEDGYKTQAQDAVWYVCPSLTAAEWFLGEPSVRASSRLMCTRIVLGGRSPRARRYNPVLAAEAWAAAEVLFGDRDGATGQARRPGKIDPGFDRPYRGQPRSSDYPTAYNINAAAHEAAGAEHHRLCERLIEYLASHGISAGELTDPPVDVAWRSHGGRQMIAEVKSCLGVDDTTQMRLGLGQVLHYRHRLAHSRPDTKAVLLVSRVREPLWYEICSSAGVRLISGDDEPAWEPLVNHRVDR